MRALVDTGAPISFFDRGAADALGLTLQQAGADYTSLRILGGSWRAKFEFVDLALTAYPGLSWTARVAFILDPALQMPFQGVLGTDGFLDKFAVTFNKYYGYFVVEHPDYFHDRVGKPLTDDPTLRADEHWRHAQS